MHSVSPYKLLKHKVLCLFNYQWVIVETAIWISGYNLKYCSVQLKSNRGGCLPYFPSATWCQVQPYSAFIKHYCILSGVWHDIRLLEDLPFWLHSTWYHAVFVAYIKKKLHQKNVIILHSKYQQTTRKVRKLMSNASSCFGVSSKRMWEPSHYYQSVLRPC